MPADDEPLPITSSYPSWWMGFIQPTQAKKEYQEGETEEENGAEAHEHQPLPTVTQHVVTIGGGPTTATSATLMPAAPVYADGLHPVNQAVRPKQGKAKKRKPRRVRTREEQDAADRDEMVKFFRRLFAEFIGTFTLVFFVAGVALEFNLTALGIDRSAAGLNQAGAGLASGLTLVFLIYSLGEICGAHFNPVITWAFTLRGLFPAAWVVPYWLAQFAGAILAGGFLQAFYFNYSGVGTTSVNPHYQWVTGFAYEALLTFFFINIILAMATRGGNVGGQSRLRAPSSPQHPRPPSFPPLSLPLPLPRSLPLTTSSSAVRV